MADYNIIGSLIITRNPNKIPELNRHDVIDIYLENILAVIIISYPRKVQNSIFSS